LDSVTLEDWGEEIFAEGVGIKWRKWVIFAFDLVNDASGSLFLDLVFWDF